MDLSRHAPCSCGSGRPARRCCAPRAQLHPEAALALRHQDLAALDARRADAIRAVEAALQDPRGDVTAAILALAPLWDDLDPNAAEVLDQVLLHGHDEAVLALADAVLPVPDRADVSHELVSTPLRTTACELVLDRHALGLGGPRSALLPSLARYSGESAAYLFTTERLRHALPRAARDRSRLRFDQPGFEVLPLLAAVAVRFGHELTRQWAFPAGRAFLARSEIVACQIAAFLPTSSGLGLDACPCCALEAPPRIDRARGATAVLVDVNAVTFTWPERLARPGGPYRAAALLEALRPWFHFLRQERLIDDKTAHNKLALLDSTIPVLAPALRDAVEDRAISAAVGRLLGRARAAA